MPTSRNTKAVDLLVRNPKNEKTVGVQVKTMHQQRKKEATKDFFPVTSVIPKEMEKVKNTFSNPFIFVYIPTDEKANPRCFVVPKEKIFSLCKEQWDMYVRDSKHREPIENIEKRKQPLSVTIKQLEEHYENKWEYLGLGG